MLQIPLKRTPTQTLAASLDGQPAEIELRQNGADMYFSLWLNTRPVVLSRICRDRQLLLVDAAYQGFIGDFVFVDMEGTSQPNYTGLTSRYAFIYLSASELP